MSPFSSPAPALSILISQRQVHVHDDGGRPGHHRGGGAGSLPAGDQSPSLLPQRPALLALQQEEPHRDFLPEAATGALIFSPPAFSFFFLLPKPDAQPGNLLFFGSLSFQMERKERKSPASDTLYEVVSLESETERERRKTTASPGSVTSGAGTMAPSPPEDDEEEGEDHRLAQTTSHLT